MLTCHPIQYLSPEEVLEFVLVELSRLSVLFEFYSAKMYGQTDLIIVQHTSGYAIKRCLE